MNHHIVIQTKDMGERIIRIADIHLVMASKEGTTTIHMHTPANLAVPAIYHLPESYSAFKERLYAASVETVR